MSWQLAHTLGMPEDRELVSHAGTLWDEYCTKAVADCLHSAPHQPVITCIFSDSFLASTRA
jgi:hypothetical protein